MAWYSSGTVNVTNGVPTVTLSGGDALLNISPDDGFVGPDGRIYAIQTIGGSGTITLASNYQGPTSSGQEYEIIPTADFNQLRDLLISVNALIVDYQAITLKAGIGLFDGGTASAPGIRGVDHEGTGLVWNGDDTLSVSIAGTIVATFSLGGINNINIEQLAEQVASAVSGVASYATVADLPDDPVPDNGTTVRVYNDPDAANNVFWIVKDGAWVIDMAYAAAISSVVQPLVDEAELAAASAAASATAAETSASTAEAASGPTYPSVGDGLAATPSGTAFAVDNGDGTVTVYLNDGGVAVEQRTLATTAALAATGGAAMIGNADYIISTTDMISIQTVPSNVPAFRTLGYSTLGDGGAAQWRRVAIAPAHQGKRQSADGGWWELTGNIVTLEMFGATGLDAAKDGKAVTDAITYLNAVGGGIINGKPKRVYHFDQVGGVGGGPGVPVISRITFNLNGATLKRPDGVLVSNFRRMFVIRFEANDSSFTLGNGIIDANYTGNQQPEGSANTVREHCASFFAQPLAGITADTLEYHDLILRDRWNFDHLSTYSGAAGALLRRQVARNITSETIWNPQLRADLIYSRNTLHCELANFDVHRVEFEFTAAPEQPIGIYLRDGRCREYLDIGGVAGAKAKDIRVFADNVRSAQSSLVRISLWDKNCDFGLVRNGIQIATWRSQNASMRCLDSGLNLATAINIGTDIDWVVDSLKLRLDAGPQTLTNNALLFPVLTAPYAHQFSMIFRNFDLLDDFGYIGAPYGHVEVINPKVRSKGAQAFTLPGTAGRPVDLTLDGGDWTQCEGKPIQLSAFNSAGKLLTLKGDWYGTTGRVGVSSTVDNTLIRNSRRIISATEPTSAIAGDELILSPPPVTGAMRKVATSTSATAATWREL